MARRREIARFRVARPLLIGWRMKKPFALAISSILLTTSVTGATVLTVSPVTAPSLYPAPRFDGWMLTSSTVASIAKREGDLALLMGWGRCEQSGGGFMDGCVRFTIGTSRAYKSYVLSDEPCPVSSSACYGGYAISSLGDAIVTDLSSKDTYEAITISTTRVGVMTLPLSLPGEPPSDPLYVLPAAPAYATTRHIAFSGSSAYTHITMADAAGDTFADSAVTVMMGSRSEGISCSELGELAEHVGHFGAAYGSAIVWLGIMEYTATLAIIGGAAAAISTKSPTAAVGAAGTIMGGGYTVAERLAGDVANVVDAAAVATGDAVELACDLAVAVDAFNPEDFHGTPQTTEYEESGAKESGIPDANDSETCDESGESVWTAPDGSKCTQECEETVVDGACKVTCVTVCL